MATAGDIATVRYNINEPDNSGDFTDEVIGPLIDSSGVDIASAVLWRRKAAKYADLVSVSEAGASHSFGELHRNALEMATKFSEPIAKPKTKGTRIHKIVRT